LYKNFVLLCLLNVQSASEPRVGRAASVSGYLYKTGPKAKSGELLLCWLMFIPCGSAQQKIKTQ